MHGTTLARLARIPLALLRRPRDLPRYAAHGPWVRRPLLSLPLPWFSYAAIDRLEKSIRPTDRVCELGGGGSTLWFARRAASVVTLESDPAWIGLLRARLSPSEAARVEIVASPLPSPFSPFDPSAYLAPLKGRSFDWVVLDFLDDEFDRRPAALPWIEQHLLSGGGALIVDDAWRYPQIGSSARASRRETFRSLGPARAGVTSTDIYFYPPRPPLA